MARIARFERLGWTGFEGACRRGPYHDSRAVQWQQDEKTYSADAKFVSGSSSAQKVLEAQIWKIGATWQTLVTHVNVCAQIGSGQPGK